MRRWINRPQNLQRVFIGQLGFVGLGALEGSRRLLNGDAQWYLGASGDNPRPDSAWDKFWSSAFGETSGDSFITPDKDPKNRPHKKAKISPPEKSMKRKRDIFQADPSVEAPKRLRGSAASSEMTSVASGRTGVGYEDPLKPARNPANVIPDTFTFKGRNVVQTSHVYANRVGATGVVENAVSVNLAKVVTLRLNSPVDINITTTGNDEANVPINGWDIWKTYYTHYSLISTKVNIHMFRRRNNVIQVTALPVSAPDAKDACRQDFYDDIPICVGFVCDPSNRLGSAQLSSLNFKKILLGPHVAHQYLMGGERCSFSYTYRPGDWDSAIENVQQDGIWTPTSQNPTTLDYFHVFTNATGANAAGEIDIIVEIEQEVQMRQYTLTTLQGLYSQDTRIAGADTAAAEPTNP